MTRASIAFVALVMSSAALAGCSDDAPATSSSTLSFTYVGRGEDGYIDQVVSISYSGSSAVVPLVEYTALDADGDALPEVTVTTAFGSDRQLLLVAPGGSIDVLQFDGPGADKVEGVRSEVMKSTSAALTETDTVIAVTPFDAAGTEVTKFDPFTEVMLDNPYSTAVHVRVVCLIYDTPAEGRPEQASEITELLPRVELAVGASTGFPIGAAVAQMFADRGLACHSLKAHLTP